MFLKVEWTRPNRDVPRTHNFTFPSMDCPAGAERALANFGTPVQLKFSANLLPLDAWFNLLVLCVTKRFLYNNKICPLPIVITTCLMSYGAQ
jgi:hypothetical protein